MTRYNHDLYLPLNESHMESGALILFPHRNEGYKWPIQNQALFIFSNQVIGSCSNCELQSICWPNLWDSLSYTGTQRGYCHDSWCCNIKYSGSSLVPSRPRLGDFGYDVACQACRETRTEGANWPGYEAAPVEFWRRYHTFHQEALNQKILCQVFERFLQACAIKSWRKFQSRSLLVIRSSRRQETLQCLNVVLNKKIRPLFLEFNWCEDWF